MQTVLVATVDEYLETIPKEMVPALQKLRTAIKKYAPEAVEGISYAVPMFKYHGNLLWFGAAKKHCAIYCGTGSLTEQLQDDLKDFDTSKGTIRFDPVKGFPDKLLKQILEIRLAENLAKANKKKSWTKSAY